MAEIDYENPEETSEPESPKPQKRGLFTRSRLILGLVILLILVGVVFAFFGLKKSDKKGLDPIASKKEKAKKNKKIKYVKLFTLSAEQTTPVLKELGLIDIPFTTEQSGKNYTISVDESRVEDARNALAIKGLPEGSARGYALLDNTQTLGVTEFDKRIRFIRALSGELENAILQFEMIETCKVQIVLPEQRLFSVTQPPVTASILIRKVPGAEITDDIVYSIIQLVSNAVENLQPENVSVIDTEGKVLSSGIFERMASKDGSGKKTSDNIRAGAAIGNPIIPNFEDIKKWQEVKIRLERDLEDKATKQLLGILPEESFKMAISADLGPLANGEIVDIKRLTISIVVDNQRQDIFLDVLMKKQIFNTIASATGYVRGRDTIQLNKADFKVSREAAKRKKELKQKGWRLFKKFLYFSPYLIGAGAAFFAGRKVVRFFKRKLSSIDLDEDLDQDSRPHDFAGIKEEIDGKKQVDRIKLIASNEPEILAQMMEQWLQEGEG